MVGKSWVWVVLTVAFGILAIIGTLGTATPLVVAGGIVGFGTTAYGLSNAAEGIHNIQFGNAGDAHTKSYNLIEIRFSWGMISCIMMLEMSL